MPDPHPDSKEKRDQRSDNSSEIDLSNSHSEIADSDLKHSARVDSFTFGSEALHVRDRCIDVWLPPKVFFENAKELTILVCLDGPEVFDKHCCDGERGANITSPFASWDLQKVVLDQMAQGAIPPVAIVQVESLDGKDREFNFTLSGETGRNSDPTVENGNLTNFSTFLCEDLRDELVTRYCFSADAEKWGLVGSSLASFVAAHVGNTREEFQSLFVLSPAQWRTYQDTESQVCSINNQIEPPRSNNQSKLFVVAIGTDEGNGCSDEGTSEGDRSEFKIGL